MVRDQGHDTNTLQSFSLAKMVISCYIAGFYLFLNKSELWTI